VSAAPVIERVAGRAFRIPTDAPEADGTLAWDHTTAVIVEASAAGVTGLGYSYTGAEAAALINNTLAAVVVGREAFAIPTAWEAMVRSIRNLGWRGICATAISAIDAALWDLKARLLGRPLVQVLGAMRAAVPIYGSGGFTSYSTSRLAEQLAGWVERDGCRWVKMKVGSKPAQDLQRVKVARSAVGDASLFVDANGAYARKQAMRFAEHFAELDVSWFEEPVSSDDLPGLRLIRDRAPPRMEDRRRRIWLRAVLLSPDARSGSRRCAADGRDALLRDHRFSACRGHCRCVHDAALRAHGAGAPSSCLLCGAATAAHRVVSRPCAHRAHAVRRRAGAEARIDPPRLVAARSRTRIQAG